jgi:hypothetical protein
MMEEEDFSMGIISLNEYRALRDYLKDRYTTLTYRVGGNNVTYLMPTYLMDEFLEKQDEAVLIQAKKYTIIACGEKGCSIETNDERIKDFLKNKELYAARYAQRIR